MHAHSPAEPQHQVEAGRQRSITPEHDAPGSRTGQQQPAQDGARNGACLHEDAGDTRLGARSWIGKCNAAASKPSPMESSQTRS